MGKQVRIVSDGTSPNTRVEVDGKILGGVRSVSWHIDAADFAVATLKVYDVEAEVVVHHVGTTDSLRGSTETRDPALQR